MYTHIYVYKYKTYVCITHIFYTYIHVCTYEYEYKDKDKFPLGFVSFLRRILTDVDTHELLLYLKHVIFQK